MTSTPEWAHRHATKLRDHWWWRPGWSMGSRFYAWHVVFDDSPDIYPLAEYWREYLRPFDFLDVVPDRWLHLTVQGVGMVEDVPDETRDRIVAAVQERLAVLKPALVRFEQVVVRPEAVALPALRPDPLDSIRQAVRAGMSDVLGAEAVPESGDGFEPHVSLAYVNRDEDATELIEVIEDADVPDSVVVPIRGLTLIEMHRDGGMYERRTVGRAAVG